VGHPVALCDF